MKQQSKLKFENHEDNFEESFYEDLTPSMNVDKIDEYSKAISWSLKNKNVKNIALTGPYGSGKSSLIKTYEQSTNNKYNFLNISLATFKSDKDKGVENELEKSILQQLIYRVEMKKIPFSRFKRINNVGNMTIILYFLSFVMSLVAGLYFFRPTYVEKIFSGTLVQQSYSNGNLINIFFSVFLIIITFIFPYIFLNSIYRFVSSSWRFNKMTIANTTLEKTNEDTQSVFDKYLDEILYFFEVTKYDVIVFEDLDRFENLDIYERLRELNLLVNNSESIKRKIVFIYAIKDEIFGFVDNNSTQIGDTIDLSKNRTKFFDFIIPVIPIINSSNSVDKLMEKLKKLPNASKIDDDFLNDVTIYIDDMRILKNIMNEFIIYNNSLGKIELNLNNLLAMVIYKNIYPFDFAQLQYQKGSVYEAFKNKNIIINRRVELLESEIDDLDKKIKKIEQESLNSIDELQKLYLYELGFVKHGTSSNASITVNGQTYHNRRAFNNDELFENLKAYNNITYELPNRGHRSGNSNDILTVFDSKQNYFEREEQIKMKSDGTLKKIKNKLLQLKNQKEEVTSYSLSDLLSKSDPEKIFPEDVIEKKLLVYLLRHGYIDEMYNHYLTYFHPGSLTEDDINFILSVKNYESLPPSHSVSNCKKVIDRMNGNEFKQKEILNYNLLEFLIDNSDIYPSHYDSFISQLCNETTESLNFIDGFKKITSKKKALFEFICTKWSNMWQYIETNPDLTEVEKDSYLSEILAYGKFNNIKEMNTNKILSNYISNHNNFLNILLDEDRRKELIAKLKVKFINLQQFEDTPDLLNYVVDNQLYEINPKNLSFLLEAKEEQLTYLNLRESNRKVVIDYVDDQIDVFVIKVLLKCAISEEREEGIIKLLNHSKLSEHLKDSVISEQSVLLSSLNEIETNYWPTIVSYRKLKANWENVIYYAHERGVADKELSSFINNNKIAQDLSEIQINDSINFETNIVAELSKEIIMSKNISDESFDMLSRSIIQFNDLPINSLSENRIKILITQGVLKMSPSNFDELIASNDSLVILYLEKNIEELLTNIETYLPNVQYLVQILSSNKVDDKNKIKLINKINLLNLMENNSPHTKTLVNFIYQKKVPLNEGCLKWIFDSDIEFDVKLQLLTQSISKLETEAITYLLTKLDKPYSEIAEKGKRPQLKKNVPNMNLVVTLEKMGYISSFRDLKNTINIFTKKK